MDDPHSQVQCFASGIIRLLSDKKVDPNKNVESGSQRRIGRWPAPAPPITHLLCSLKVEGGNLKADHAGDLRQHLDEWQGC